MCPPELLSCGSYINLNWTDEQLMLFLQERSIKDPFPSNVIIEVNPFNIEPWNAPDNMWYLYNSEEPDYSKGVKGLRDTGAGYWKEMGPVINIFTGFPAVGRKVTREFYVGATPNGDKTGWTMIEYKMEYRKQQGHNEAQGFSSLCRIFWHNNEVLCYENQDDSLTVDADTDGAHIEAMLLSMLEQEERNLSLMGSSNRSQVVHGDEQGPSAVSGRGLEDSDSNNAAGVHAINDFLSGDFLEMNDFDDLWPSSSSSSSDDSSRMSRTSDEYFDPVALLWDLENENSPFVEENDINCKFSVSGSFRPHQVVVRPPPSGSVFSNGSHLLTGECKSTSSLGRQEMNPTVSSSAEVLITGNEVTPPSESSKRNKSSRQVTSMCSEDAGTSQVPGTKPFGRIVKLGKKYFCFS